MTIEHVAAPRLGLPAIIGGTGIAALPADTPTRRQIVATRWGNAAVDVAHFGGRDLLFLHRHADPDRAGAHLPPHRVNYRANIAALKIIGATAIFASTAVGSLRANWRPGTLVLLDQLLDFSSQRPKTFFDDHVVHIDFTQPYCEAGRGLLQQTASKLNIELQTRATYLCAEGPRFETAAEIRLYANWGADVVGMTGAPEAVLAREANLSYAGISIVTNLAAGISPSPLTQAEVLDAMQSALPRVTQLLLAAALDYRDDPTIPSRRATDEFRTPEFDPQQFIIESV
jgi:5'-methylthioadenosine phosphorylase